MKILKKAVALLLTVLLAFSSMSVLASAEFDPTVDGGFDLEYQIKLFRNNGTAWVEVEQNKLKPGEAVKARVYIGTNYFTDSGSFICFYDTEFFTSAYTTVAKPQSVNTADGTVAKICEVTADGRAVNGGEPAVIYGEGSIYDNHVGLMTSYTFSPSAHCTKLNINEWMFEYDLQVLTSPSATYGGIFALPSTVRSTTNQRGLVNAPKAESADNLANNNESKSMKEWDANVTFINNDVFDDSVNDSNFGEINNTITFNANGGEFLGGADDVVKTGLIGTSLNFNASVAEPTRNNFTFVGWYPITVTTPTEDDCVASDEFDYTALTYMALWKAADVTITFDANSGKFSDNTTTKEVDVANGTPITAPESPTRDGFTFDGWFNGAGDELTSGVTTAPTADTTYTAKWVPVTGTAYKVVVNYLDKATGNNATRVFDFSGTTGNTVNILEEDPATVPANTIIHTLDEFALTNYELDTTKANELSEVISGDGTTVLNLYYKAKTYTATFDPNSGNFSGSTDNYEVNQEFYEFVDGPADPTRTGCTFAGWNPTYTDGETRLLKDTTFTARWTPNKYNATFMVGTSQYYQVPVEYGTAISLPPAPSGAVIEGNTFDGWTPTPGIMDDVNGKVFNAILTPIELTATFDANGGTFTSGTTKSESYNFGDTIVAPAEDPTNGTLTFGGWFTTGGVQLTATTTMPSTSITYYAKWTGEGTHTATFDAGEGTFGTSSISAADYAENSFIGAPGTATREGYTFILWENAVTGTDYEPGVTKMGSENVTFYAVWAKNATITYNVDGVEYESFDTCEGRLMPFPLTDPEKTGYEFTGWETATGETPSSLEIVPDHDVAFEAQFEAIDYNITYTVTGTIPAGAPTAPADATANYEDSVAVAAKLTFAEYVFNGWNTSDVTVDGDGNFSMPAKDVSFTGSWSPVGAETFTISYYNVAGDLYTTQNYEEGATITPPTDPTKDGMSFDGWTTTPGSETPTALPATMPNGNISAYALWTPNEYTVTYMVDGAVYQEYATVLFGAEVPVPTDPTKADKVFSGWTPDAPSTMPSHDLTFTANWIDPPAPGEYTVTYYKAFGKTHYAATASEGDPVPTPGTDPTLFGHKFAGWEPAAPATMPAENLEFKAQWEVDETFVAIVIGGTVISGTVIGVVSAITAGTVVSVIGGALVIGIIAHAVKDNYTVTYMVGDSVYKTYKVAAGAKVPVPDDPSKAGSDFKGWSPSVPETMPENDLTFQAQWAADGASTDFPDTGSAVTGITAFALISSAAAAAYVVMMRKRKEA